MEQLTLEHVAAIVYTMIAVGAVGIFAMVLYTRKDVIRALFYVQPKPEPDDDRTDTPYRSIGDIDQLEPVSIDAPHTGVIPSNEALARHLSVLIKPSGVWWLSANKIAAAVGGDRATVLAWIREERGQPDPPLVNPLRVRDERGERLIPR